MRAVVLVFAGAALAVAVPAVTVPAAAFADATPLSQVSPERWMHDLAPQLHYRKLSEIVIPGSHDTDTYGLSKAPYPATFQDLAWPYARTQNEDITAQLNTGIREFDLRVTGVLLRTGTVDYFANHGGIISPWLRFSDLLDQIRDWTLANGHEQEIILLNMSITGYGFPSAACRAFTTALGSALLTPSELQAAYGTRDPGQVTLGQLWSMHGHPRVIMDSTQCMDSGIHTPAGEPVNGQWSTDPDNPDPSQRGIVFSSYYANQCYAGPYWGWFTDFPGIKDRVLAAARSRATQGGGDDVFPGHAVNLGPAKPGGLYVLFIQATPTASCLLPLSWFDLSEDRTVLAAVYDQWLNDPDIRKNLNIVSGDFVEETDLVKDVIAMDSVNAMRANEVTAQTPERVVAEQDEQLPAGLFDAHVSYDGIPPYGLGLFGVVHYQISLADGRDGPNMDGSTTHSEMAWLGNRGVVKFDGVSAGPRVGTWTVTASLDGGVKEATWTLVVEPSRNYVLEPVARNPDRVEAGSVSGGFAVRAVNTAGHPVPHAPVTFRAPSGTFDGQDQAEVRTDQVGIARSPSYRAGTRAGAASIVVESAAPSTSVPLTVTAARPASFVPLHGNEQTTMVERNFPRTLTGHYLDRYDNVVENPSPDFDEFVVRGPGATWRGGTSTITVTPSADGTFILPPLRAGGTVLDATSNSDCRHVVCVAPRRFPSVEVHGTGWILRVTPGRPHTLTIIRGDGQQTHPGQPFARSPLAVKLTDVAGNPIPGASVSFRVTSGEASFPAENLSLLVPVTGDQTLVNHYQAARHRLVVTTSSGGIATAPELTAGQKLGQMEVTASAGGEATDAVFRLSVT